MEFDRYLEAVLKKDAEEDERTIRLMFELSARMVRQLRFLRGAETDEQRMVRLLDDRGVTVRTIIPSPRTSKHYFEIAFHPILSHHGTKDGAIPHSVKVTLSCGKQAFLSGVTCSTESLRPKKIAKLLMKKARRAGIALTP